MTHAKSDLISKARKREESTGKMILRQSLVLALFFLISTSLCAARLRSEFKSASEALEALDKMGECKCDTDVWAYRYFTSHPDESIPILIDFTLTRKQRYHVGIRALSKIKDERVTTFLLNLADDEINNRNDPANDSEGSYNKNHPYYREGLITQVILVLVDLGDPRAIPIAKKAIERPNLSNFDIYTYARALYKLGEFSLDSIYEFHAVRRDKPMKDMVSLARTYDYQDPRFSVDVFEWIIAKSPEDKDLLRECHLGMVSPYFNVSDYEKALEQCDFIRKEAKVGKIAIEGLTFEINHEAYTLPRLEKLLKGKLGIEP